MNFRAFAGQRTLSFALSLCVLALFPERPKGAVLDLELGTNTAVLEHTICQHPLAFWGLNLNPEPKAFQKEPNTGGRKVARASMAFGFPSEQPTALLWDYTKGKLYLDLNHNRDLTDDPEGVLTYPVSRFNYFYQSFNNVRFTVKTSRGGYPLVLNLNLYAPEGNRMSGTAALLSFWGGKITLGGRDYHVGKVDASPVQVGNNNEGSLLLRPWGERELPWDLMNGHLDAFAFSPNLFFGGKAYRVDCSLVQYDNNSKYRISFREKEVELGDLKLSGQFIERAVLTASRDSAGSNRKKAPEMPAAFTVVLDRPESVVKVPVGEYQKWQVTLKSGGTTAYNDPLYSSSQPIVTVAPNTAKPVVLVAGGPLTNSVWVETRGRNLTLNYRVLGAGSHTYQLASLDRSRPPRFNVYQNGKRIHSGKFEFG